MVISIEMGKPSYQPGPEETYVGTGSEPTEVEKAEIQGLTEIYPPIISYAQLKDELISSCLWKRLCEKGHVESVTS